MAGPEKLRFRFIRDRVTNDLTLEIVRENQTISIGMGLQTAKNLRDGMNKLVAACEAHAPKTRLDS